MENNVWNERSENGYLPIGPGILEILMYKIFMGVLLHSETHLFLE